MNYYYKKIVLNNKDYNNCMKNRFVFAGLFLLAQLLLIGGSCKSTGKFIEEEVVFRNDLHDATFTGTLTKPSGKDKFPVVILISGSGQQDRDETVYGHKPSKILAEFLSSNGVGVLRYDDRGIGGSTGDVWSASLEVQASDAYAGIHYLKSRKDIDHDNIGIIGHSIGALQGTILASKYQDISFLVMLGGLGIPFCENHIKADSLSNKLQGKPDEIIEAGRHLLESLCDAIKEMPDNQDYTTSKNILIHTISEWQASLEGEAKAEIDDFTKSNPDFWIKNIAEEYATPIYISCMKYEPYDYLTNIECPVLSIIGAKDVQVVPENNAAIQKALEEAGNKNFRVVAPENINHIFQRCETGLISEYIEIDEDFNIEIMELILEWLNENKN